MVLGIHLPLSLHVTRIGIIRHCPLQLKHAPLEKVFRLTRLKLRSSFLLSPAEESKGDIRKEKHWNTQVGVRRTPAKDIILLAVLEHGSHQQGGRAYTVSILSEVRHHICDGNFELVGLV